jgi:hypothetical protein
MYNPFGADLVLSPHPPFFIVEAAEIEEVKLICSASHNEGKG